MTPKLLTREVCRSYIETHLFTPGVATGADKSPNAGGRIGLELEAFPYSKNKDGIPIIPNNGGHRSLSNALVNASRASGGIETYASTGLTGAENVQLAAIEFPDNSRFQFEPGGQVEISTAPCENFLQVSSQLGKRQEILASITSEENIHFGYYGTNPWFRVEEIGLQLTKTRYRALEKYFEGINTFGRQMMLQTCSLQVNLDLGTDPATQVMRTVAANLLAPFATALFANSGITAGKVNGYKSHRSHIWQQLDPTRTGTLQLERVSRSFDKKELIDAYLRFALNAPVIYIEDFGEEVFPPGITLAYWIAHGVKGIYPAISHLKNHLSLLFPEVRPKGYLELRSADAPLPEWQMVPPVFYCGLLYSGQQLLKTLDLLLPYVSRLPMLMEKASRGLDSAEIFGISKKLMLLAIEGFSGLPDTFRGENDTRLLIAFSESFTMQRKTQADRWLENFKH